LYKDYSTKAQIIKDLRKWPDHWEIMASVVFGDSTEDTLEVKRQRAINQLKNREKGIGPRINLEFLCKHHTVEECLKVLCGDLLSDKEIQAQIKWKNRQKCIERKKSKAQGGNLRAIWKAMAISDKWPDAVRIAIYNKLQETYSHVPTTPRSEKSTSRQRAPRSHHRVAVSVRGGDSGDDESGESDPPAPPLSWRSCPYHRLPSHNPQLLEPLQLFPCGDVSRGRYRRRSFVVDSGRCAA
jgi:hypothetical protein